MRPFVEGVDRGHTILFPESLDDWLDENNPVRVIDTFVDPLNLRALD
jgi:transposase